MDGSSKGKGGSATACSEKGRESEVIWGKGGSLVQVAKEGEGVESGGVGEGPDEEIEGKEWGSGGNWKCAEEGMDVREGDGGGTGDEGGKQKWVAEEARFQEERVYLPEMRHRCGAPQHSLYVLHLEHCHHSQTSPYFPISMDSVS
ncbi:hypothetical protein PIB30_011958 [Stylosanthes scabra]|uniref:Uncharacterized protein n=1 Tax=Stylosanthes scabra TaxID=79078 RepID=A0ABU6X490_9FABA|nr:hypothetical protein [Stylosanthes scabra]